MKKVKLEAPATNGLIPVINENFSEKKNSKQWSVTNAPEAWPFLLYCE